VTYTEMEIKKGGSIRGSIYKTGSNVPAKQSAPAPAAPPPPIEPEAQAAPEVPIISDEAP